MPTIFRLPQCASRGSKYLYHNGDECKGITGGWVGGDGSSLGYTGDHVASPTTIIVEANRIGFANQNSTSKYLSLKYITTIKKIDLTSYSKVTVQWLYAVGDNSSSTTGTAHGFGFADTFNSTLAAVAGESNYTGTRDRIVTYQIDISALHGHYYPILNSHHVRNNSLTSYLYLYDLLLTP